MAAGAFERTGLTASVVSLSTLRATAYAPNKKANPSRGKMALSYLVQVDLADKKSFQDEVDWRAAGAGRNCYFFRSYHLVLKMFVDPLGSEALKLKVPAKTSYLRVPGFGVAFLRSFI